MDTTKTYPKKIFISRKNASARRSFNEDEIAEFMSKNGYTIVAPETYSVAEQVALFHHAKCIVACSGAAFTNLLYCQSGSKVIIMNNYRQPIGVFNTIATLVGVETLNLSGYDEDIPVGMDVHKCFIMSLERLRDAMERMEMIW
jgi:capsular polysaccharide biosynthesis protein